MSLGLPFRRRALLGLLVAGLMAACASPPRLSAPQSLSGRFALVSQGEVPQSLSASFALEGTAEQGLFVLNSPLGSRLAEARWQPGRVWLRDAQGDHDYEDLDDLARHALGESVPLEALPDWLRGRPSPLGFSDALPGGFQQMGWRIDLSRQAEGRIELQRVAPPLLRLRVRLEAEGAAAP